MSISTKVVTLQYLENEIAVINMEDRENKNTFSPQFVKDLLSVFAEVNNNSYIKAVVIHGYDHYFCCGGTYTDLFDIHDGKKVFTDYGSYQLFLDCPVPIIAAMQGHALGVGLVLGTYADILVMAEEAFYSANFMKYGFTPGFGATYFLPKKLGVVAAEAMMFDGKNHQGAQLKDWGVDAIFTRQQNVIDEALIIAKKITRRTRKEIILLKRQLTQEDKLKMPMIIEQEVAMQSISFKQPEVKERINRLYINANPR